MGGELWTGFEKGGPTMGGFNESELTKQQLHDIHEAFNLFDKDGDGAITAKELGEVMGQMGLNPTEDDLQDMINEVDTDGSGMIEIDEFIQLMVMKEKAAGFSQEDEIRAVFEIFDTDKNGSISHEELRKGMAKFGEYLSEGEVTELIKDIDLDGNGELDFNEFHQFVLSL